MMSKTKMNTIYEEEIEHIEGRVKWYKPDRGYGFLTLDENSEDIFLHFSVLDKFGFQNVAEGDLITCEVVLEKERWRVIRVSEIKFAPRKWQASANFDSENLEQIKGTVKWFNPFKKYGFIIPDDGGKDVFLHTEVLRAAGYKSLEPGVRVLFNGLRAEGNYEIRSIQVVGES